MSNIESNGNKGATESGVNGATSVIIAPQRQLPVSNASAYSLQAQHTHQPLMQLLQQQATNHPSLVKNGGPQSQMFMNSNMGQAAAYAAAANAAQQVLQAQMRMMPTNGNNSNIQNGVGFNHDHVNGSMGGINMHEQMAAFFHHHQQTQLNAQTQAQVAAIMAASGVGNGMIINEGQASSQSLSAAQALTLMLKQQQAITNHQQQQQSMQAPVTNSPPQQMYQIIQPDSSRIEPLTAPSPQETKVVPVETKTPNTTVVQQPDQKVSPSPPKRKKVCNRVKKQKLQQQKETTVSVSSASSAPQTQQTKLALTPSFSQQTAPSPFQQHGQGLFQNNISPIVLLQMRSWKLNQLESHIQLLQETSQPIPHAVQILLNEARKVEQKRAAKRIANRKSACTSRARKKALVAEMTKANARLRRQAVILSLLPDLVIAIKDDGTITFCSTQVERVLHHKVSHMIGANIEDILTPTSRTALSALVKKLVTAEKVILEESNNKEGDESGRSSAFGNTLSAAIVSEQSDQFPPAVVKVKTLNLAEGGNDAANSSVTGATLCLSAMQSSLSNSDNVSSGSVSNNSGKQKNSGNSDGDSSSSSEPKNLTKANDALSRNVRFHNEQLKIKENKKFAHTDDYTGDSVTANNADARLSSLMKASEIGKEVVGEEKNALMSNIENLEDTSSSSSCNSLLAGVEDRQKKRKRVDNASDDGEESDPSREDSALSTSDASNRRPRPLAPTCNICLIRDDLTTIWCEVTSSIRTVTTDDDQTDVFSSSEKKNDASSTSSDDQQASNSNSTVIQTKELLLCLRPTRDGGEKVPENLRFFPKKLRGPEKTQEHEEEQVILVESNVDSIISNSSKSEEHTKNRPMKKRPLSKEGGDLSAMSSPPKKDIIETEKSVVESLLLMSNKSI